MARPVEHPDTLVLADATLSSLVSLLSLQRPDLALLAPSTPDSGALAVIRRQADLAGARVLDAGELPSAGEGVTLSRSLLDACELASREGCSRVVWPVFVNASIDAIALALDRARLVSTLASLDIRGRAVRIDTPALDLTEHQLADLAADVGVPAQRGWWIGPDADRWLELVAAADARRRQPA
ncbi:MAG: hypothetical protein KF684_00440 [Phycisphaeraceae bacterium]|nr:hypothetical protein [Phycisphaeraceae bacterium]